MILPDAEYNPQIELYQSLEELKNLEEKVTIFEELPDKITASNGVNFRFGVTDTEEYGYILEEEGVDVTQPFVQNQP